MRVWVRFVPAIVVLLLVSGCKKGQPALAGGKPVSYWVESLSNPDPKLRKTAVFKLGNVGTTDPAVFPALLGALRDDQAGVRREAILALLKCGDAARDAVPLLTQISRQDRDLQVRSYAVKALDKLQGHGE